MLECIRASRQRGQAIALVPIGLIAMFGMLALVVNLGLIFLLRSELQNAVDAAALAAAWYYPVCQEQEGTGSGARLCGSDFPSAAGAATFYFNRNVSIASQLCDLSGNPQVEPGGNPQATTLPPNYVIVYATCTAHMSFGGLFNLTVLAVNASSTAALCDASISVGGGQPACTSADLTSVTSLTPPGSISTRLIQ
jgi:uncharacterized membrane protein